MHPRTRSERRQQFLARRRAHGSKVYTVDHDDWFLPRFAQAPRSVREHKAVAGQDRQAPALVGRVLPVAAGSALVFSTRTPDLRDQPAERRWQPEFERTSASWGGPQMRSGSVAYAA